MADPHVGDVGEADRNAAARGDNDRLQITRRPGQPDAAHVELFPAALEETAAGVRVVACDSLGHLVERDPILDQVGRSHEHLILLRVAAETVHLGHPGEGAQAWGDDPVLERAQLHRVVAVALERVLKDLAEARRDRGQFGLHAFRQVLARLLEALEDELPTEVDVGPVAEDDHDLGETVF